MIWLLQKKGEKEYSLAYSSVDALIPAFNEEITIARIVSDLLQNKFIGRIIVIDDGSTDRTAEIVSQLQSLNQDRVILLRQKNTGKAGAINAGLAWVESDKVF